jgi:hypothetical protein
MLAVGVSMSCPVLRHARVFSGVSGVGKERVVPGFGPSGAEVSRFWTRQDTAGFDMAAPGLALSKCGTNMDTRTLALLAPTADRPSPMADMAAATGKMCAAVPGGAEPVADMPK